MKYLVEVFWSDGDQGYIAVVPDLPGCSAWGSTPGKLLMRYKML
jgi:predicted RNase H-like HicB family nuclease